MCDYNILRSRINHQNVHSFCRWWDSIRKFYDGDALLGSLNSLYYWYTKTVLKYKVTHRTYSSVSYLCNLCWYLIIPYELSTYLVHAIRVCNSTMQKYSCTTNGNSCSDIIQSNLQGKSDATRMEFQLISVMHTPKPQ